MTVYPFQAVAVGASAGAIEALSLLLSALPADFSPVLVVVHLPPDKKSLMAELFQAKCRMNVKEAEDKERIEAGTVYLAPPDYHLLVETDKRLSLSSEEPVLYSRPSINVLFESAAEAYGSGLAGVILTGANNDGARGLCAVAEKGGAAFVQRPDTAYASAMPQAALDACHDAKPFTLEQIADYLQEFASL